MHAVTNEIAKLTLSMFLALSQLFSEGVAQLEQKKFDEAGRTFSKIIESPESSALKVPALYLRARCHIHAEEKDAAEKDLALLLESFPGTDLWNLALADYKEMTGKDWEGLNLSTPAAAWQSLLMAGKKRDPKMLDACCTGEMKGMVAMVMREDRFWDEVTREILSANIESMIYNSASNKVCLVLQKPNSSRNEKMVMSRDNQGCWRLAGPAEAHRDPEFRSISRDGSSSTAYTTTLNRLRQLDAAIEQYTMASRNPPRKLEDASEYVKDFSTARLCALDGKPFVFAMPNKGGKPWVFMAEPHGGQRHGVINGSVRSMNENEFKELAVAHGISLVSGWEGKEIKVSEEEVATIQALIRDLGSNSYEKRLEARKALKDFGGKAGKLLQEAAKSSDPEVALAARKILSEI